MNKEKYVLVDHRMEWSNLRPLSITKPVSFLRIGILRIFEKWEKHLNSEVNIKTVQKYLSSFDTYIENEDATYINSSILPSAELVAAVKNLNSSESLYKNGLLIASKREASGSKFEKEIEFEGEILKIDFPWDIFKLNEEAIALDFHLLTKNRKSENISASNTILGDSENIFIEKGAKVEASILNSNGGFIYLAKNSEIMEGSVVRGSLALCENASLKLLTKIYGSTTVGPHSKVGGEVNNSVIQGFSNKGHDGFLGNSVIGEWCNLGADTNNSNLKNNYSHVRSWSFEQNDYIETGLQFCGLIMGDHTKCGINTMFNTGTVTGVFANIFGGNFPPKYIPSFAWGGSGGFSEYEFDKAIQVAKAVMKRRNIELSKNDEDILKHIFDNK